MAKKGDIAFRYLNYLKSNSPIRQTANEENRDNNQTKRVTVCDINQNMLEVGKKRALALKYNEDIRWQLGNAEDLNLEKENTYDVYTIAFGIRNCTHLDKVVREAYRVLKVLNVYYCKNLMKSFD